MGGYRGTSIGRQIRAAAMVSSVALMAAAPISAASAQSEAQIAPTSSQPASAAPGSSTPAPIAGNPEIRSRLAAAEVLVAGETTHHNELRRFYAAHGNDIVWASRADQANALLAAVARAGDQGLDPNLFHMASLTRAPSTLNPVERDLLLTDAFLGYADALAHGAVSLEERSVDEDLSPTPVDVVATLDAAIATPAPARTIEALAPRFPEYAAMLRGYQGYRAIARSGGWPRIADGQRLDRNGADQRVAALQKRLTLEGYLPANYDSGNRYDEATERAVKLFQEYHGLEADGRLSPTTVAELNVGADKRAEQVAVNLERLRWLPRDMPADRLWVSLAQQQLTYFRNNQPAFVTRVIIGETDKQTPEFQGAVTSVLYNPPWNLPASIVQKEIMPKVSADPSYLSRHRMVMKGNGHVMQEPGVGNALGQLKFEMQNKFDVYLHDTPSKNLFVRGERMMSHGCVRVQNPRELASMLTGMSREAIDKAISTNVSNRRFLATTLPVFLVYHTAYAAEDGSIRFARDSYERDEDIRKALNRGLNSPVAQDAAGNPRRG